MSLANMATTVTQHNIYEAPGVSFKQYIGNASIADQDGLRPGDVLIDVESMTVSYIGHDGMQVQWTSIANADSSRHPTIGPHYILVPLQLRFSWLSVTGYTHFRKRALDFNPDDKLELYIEQLRRSTSHNVGIEEVPPQGDTIKLENLTAHNADEDADGITEPGLLYIHDHDHSVHYMLLQIPHLIVRCEST